MSMCAWALTRPRRMMETARAVMASDGQSEGADTETDEGGAGTGAGPGEADALERELNFQVSAHSPAGGHAPELPQQRSSTYKPCQLHTCSQDVLVAVLSDDPQELDEALLHRLPSVLLAHRPLPPQLLALASLLLVPASTPGEPPAPSPPLRNHQSGPLSRHVPPRATRMCAGANTSQDGSPKHPRAAALACACFRLAAEALAGGTTTAADAAAADPCASCSAADVGLLAKVRLRLTLPLRLRVTPPTRCAHSNRFATTHTKRAARSPRLQVIMAWVDVCQQQLQGGTPHQGRGDDEQGRDEELLEALRCALALIQRACLTPAPAAAALAAGSATPLMVMVTAAGAAGAADVRPGEIAATPAPRSISESGGEARTGGGAAPRFPPEAAWWLVVAAWNRGVHHARFNRRVAAHCPCVRAYDGPGWCSSRRSDVVSCSRPRAVCVVCRREQAGAFLRAALDLVPWAPPERRAEHGGRMRQQLAQLA